MNQPLFVEMNLQVMAVLGNGVPRIGLGLGLGGPVAKVEKIGVGIVGGWFVVKKKLISRKLSFFRVRASFSGSSTSRLGLNPETFQPQESSKMLWIGPVPGDISEVEAYCRIFRAAEKLNTAVMRTVCNPETGECDAPYDNMPILEEKVVTMLGSMLPLLNRGREEVLSGRSSLANTYRGADLSVMESKLPPLAVFRGDMKKCCENLHVALANYLTPLDNQSANIWEKMQRLKNVCYDAGFPRGEGHPNPTLFANWSPVYLSNKKEEITAEDCEVAFWKGGQVTAEGLNWLLDKRFKTIVDLRNDVVVDKYYQKAIDHAISNGKLELVTMHVEVGTAPSMEQVKQFAGLVSDLSKQPLYLHSQEGVSRTSAMVSRWRQYIGRLLSRSTSNKTNRKDAFEEGSKVTSPPKYDSSKQEVELLSNENGSPLKELGSDVSVAPIGANHTNGDSSDMNINGVTKSSDGEVAEASNYGIVKGVNPLKSQIPTVDIFSRKEMTHFFNHKKISPQTFLDFQSERFRNRIIFRGGSTVSVKKFGTNLAAQSSESTNPAKTNGAYSGTMSSSNVINFNEHRKRRNDHSPSLVDSGEIFNFPKSSTPSKVNGQVLSGDGEKMISNGTSKPIDGSADLVEGNMCASTTGVVRIQSRKKAEMFLVRTDGVSCSREKVTESSLAFTHPSTQQQMLMWKSPPKTVLLLKKLGNELMEEAKEVTSFLHHQEKMNILVEPDVHDMFARIPGFGYVQTFYSQDISDLHERVDFVACLGGDGVILHASNLFKGAVPPVVSFNLGSLGFLTSHTFEDYMEDLRSVIHGNNTLGVYITLRMRLHCQVFRKGQAVPGKIFDVLNEVVVDRGSNPYISKIECYEHMRLITKVQGDGVIVATPTGSTAYSTAAGGSMVHPNVPCMLFTPICPHSLSFRPVILPDSAQLELKIPEDARSNAWVSFDGKRRQQLSRGDSVKICMSQHPLPTVNKFDQTGDWFRSLIRCLNWNERLEQRAF